MLDTNTPPHTETEPVPPVEGPEPEDNEDPRPRRWNRRRRAAAPLHETLAIGLGGDSFGHKWIDPPEWA